MKRTLLLSIVMGIPLFVFADTGLHFDPRHSQATPQLVFGFNNSTGVGSDEGTTTYPNAGMDTLLKDAGTETNSKATPPGQAPAYAPAPAYTPTPPPPSLPPPTNSPNGTTN